MVIDKPLRAGVAVKSGRKHKCIYIRTVPEPTDLFDFGFRRGCGEEQYAHPSNIGLLGEGVEKTVEDGAGDAIDHRIEADADSRRFLRAQTPGRCILSIAELCDGVLDPLAGGRFHDSRRIQHIGHGLARDAGEKRHIFHRWE